MNTLPYDVLEAMVQCFGKAFFYKDGMESFLRSAEVPPSLTQKYREEHKFVWARKLLTDLGQTEQGCVLQRRILRRFCDLRRLPDGNVPDPDTGLSALRHLKSLVVEHELSIRHERNSGKDNRHVAEEKQRLLEERAAKLERQRSTFNEAVLNHDRLRAGYCLEEILADLFGLFEIEYRRSYRTPHNTQQLDGSFSFGGFDYLVEAKWRRTPPTEQEIGGFKHKVDGKLESTRGLFVSVAGFRPEVVESFNGRGANVLLMDGTDLIHVLEGRIDLRDALRLKIEKAAQEGVVFCPALA